MVQISLEWSSIICLHWHMVWYFRSNTMSFTYFKCGLFVQLFFWVHCISQLCSRLSGFILFIFSLLLCCRSRLLGYIYTEWCGHCVITCSSLFYFIYLYLIFIFGSMVIKNVDCCYSWYIDIWSFLKVILYTHPHMYLIRIWLWLYFTVFTIVQGIAVC